MRRSDYENAEGALLAIFGFAAVSFVLKSPKTKIQTHSRVLLIGNSPGKWVFLILFAFALHLAQMESSYGNIPAHVANKNPPKKLGLSNRCLNGKSIWVWFLLVGVIALVSQKDRVLKELFHMHTLRLNQKDTQLSRTLQSECINGKKSLDSGFLGLF